MIKLFLLELWYVCPIWNWVHWLTPSLTSACEVIMEDYGKYPKLNPQHNITQYKETTYFLGCMEIYTGNKQFNQIWYLLQYVFNRMF